MVNHFVKGGGSFPVVVERDVINYCNVNNIFYIEVDGGTNKGLREAFEYGPCSYLLKNENNTESIIYQYLQRMIEF